ncbi:MAG TPA: glycosyltransferase family A protein [Geomonas sp.]|nr:glycosyltransferase family A protein [Geomonas sp.]
MSESAEQRSLCREPATAIPERYVLVTAAHNEASHIQGTIDSVVNQTLLPERWVIVSDSSTDATDDIIKESARRYPFIQYVRLDRNSSASSADFASKVFAVAHGYRLLKNLPFQYIGNLDADVSFGEDYFASLLGEFRTRPGLGIGGGIITERGATGILVRPHNGLSHVSGAAQFFRRACWEAIGGYLPVAAGGEDTIAIVMARMKGWQVVVFPQLTIQHHKLGNHVRGALRESFRDGAKDYALGSHPVFQLLKSLSHLWQRPYLLDALVRTFGFFWQYCKQTKRQVDPDFVRYFRSEQWDKLKSRCLR